jgi:hypothetical protein
MVSGTGGGAAQLVPTPNFRQVDQRDHLLHCANGTLYQHGYIGDIRVERLAGGSLPP